MSQEIRMVQARKSDLDIVLSILEQAARWLAVRGIRQWEPSMSPQEHVSCWIERGEMYLAELDGGYFGTLAFQWSDEETWGEMPGDAGYVHGLAVRREFAGRGLGYELLRWAEDRVAASGRKYLRLDCGAGNLALNEYYESAGFDKRGTARVGDLEVSLYEKRVNRAG